MGNRIEVPRDGLIGPILYFRGVSDGRMQVATLLAVPSGSAAPRITGADGPVAPILATSAIGWDFHLAEFTIASVNGAQYRVGDRTFTLQGDHSGDLRIAYVSCNGQETGDLDRPADERNAMWERLAKDHDASPFQLLLHGGDQIYADEATEAHPLSAGWPKEHAQSVPEADRDALRAALRDDFYARYVALYARSSFAHLGARVPSLAMWDDHDICDGWGSLRPRAQDSDVAPILFDVAREAFLLFQCGTAPGEVPPLCPDKSGTTLGFCARLPGLTIVAPDLRSERSKAQVMGPDGWRALESMLAPDGAERALVMSSVPALGPRLSVVERWMQRTPWMESYEDDLRDQWQSHAHRTEWQRFLRGLVDLKEAGTGVTVLSGEIHLATRGTMETAQGPLHQLVASGIAHPPPPGAYPAVLGVLARFGEAPLKDHPIRLHPLPGQSAIYVAERNYLTLSRQAGAWHASWHLEDSGVTAPLPI